MLFSRFFSLFIRCHLTIFLYDIGAYNDMQKGLKWMVWNDMQKGLMRSDNTWNDVGHWRFIHMHLVSLHILSMNDVLMDHQH